MYEKAITYKDFDGNERTETFRFHLNEAELTKMELGVDGGLTSYMDRIVEAQSTSKIIGIFEELVDRSYGVKSLDGRKFEKSPEILADFKATNAYSQFFTEVALDAEKATEFMLKIMPDDMRAKIAEAEKSGAFGNANLNDKQREVLHDAMSTVAAQASNVGTNNIATIPADSQQ